MVASLREGDYSFRARGASARDPMGELAGEINALADLLQKQRVRSLEATALLARILEVMHAPLFAFDRENVLQLVNNAGTQLLQRPYARCFGHSPANWVSTTLLAAPDQSIHSFGSKPARWLLRKAVFRQDGVPHTLLLLADVSLPLQEEEQAAWKRLIRVLGHELSNSLAPIKSIAGSLLARVDHMEGERRHGSRFPPRPGRGGEPRRRPASLCAVVSAAGAVAAAASEAGSASARCWSASCCSSSASRCSSIPVRPSSLNADPDQLEQMFINLLANAVDAIAGQQRQAGASSAGALPTPIRVGHHRRQRPGNCQYRESLCAVLYHQAQGQRRRPGAGAADRPRPRRRNSAGESRRWPGSPRYHSSAYGLTGPYPAAEMEITVDLISVAITQLRPAFLAR